MLAVNGKSLDLTVAKDPYVKYYRECMETLWKTMDTDTIEITYTKNHLSAKLNNTTEQKAAAVWVECTESLSTSIDGQINKSKWTYYESDDMVNGVPRFLPNKFYFTGRLLFKKGADSEDKLFYMVFVSPRCEGYEGLKELQNYRIQVTKDFQLYNALSIARAEEVKELRQYEIHNNIYKDMDEDQVRAAANNYGCIGASSLDIVYVRKTLFNKIISSNKHMSEFDPCKYTSELARVSRVVAEAEERGILDYTKTTRLWKIMDFDKTKTAILEVPKGIEEYKKYLLKYLRDNDDILTQIRTNTSAYDEKKKIANMIKA